MIVHKGKKYRFTQRSLNFEQNGYYYEYISGSYDESISIYAPKKYLVGHTESYNGTSNPQMLQYAQTNSATVSWSVSSQISSSIEVESAYFSGLSLELGYSFNRTTTTGSSIQILTQIEIDPGDSGYIDAFLPGGYSSGIAKYKEYMLHPYLGFLATGNTLNVNVGGWSPIASSSLNVLNFNTETY